MTNMRRAFSLLAALGFSFAAAAPQPEPWPRWEKHDPSSELQVGHVAWDNFLKAVIEEADGINLIAYGKVTPARSKALDEYIEALATTQVSELSRDEQLAYWINLYNSLTVQVILRNYPVDSIRDISGSLFSPGPWDDEVVTVESESLTLNDIEHRILRPIWNDPRVHYAVNCASIGCPNLASEAYTAANTEQLLETNARAYVNHPRGVTVNDESLTVSSIYVWFKDDFGGDDAGVLSHLRQHANADLRDALQALQKIDDDKYDWSLNSPK